MHSMEILKNTCKDKTKYFKKKIYIKSNFKFKKWMLFWVGIILLFSRGGENGSVSKTWKIIEWCSDNESDRPLQTVHLYVIHYSDSSKTTVHLEGTLSSTQILTKLDTVIQATKQLLLRSRQKMGYTLFRSKQGLKMEMNCFASNLLPRVWETKTRTFTMATTIITKGTCEELHLKMFQYMLKENKVGKFFAYTRLCFLHFTFIFTIIL